MEIAKRTYSLAIEYIAKVLSGASLINREFNYDSWFRAYDFTAQNFPVALCHNRRHDSLDISSSSPRCEVATDDRDGASCCNALDAETRWLRIWRALLKDRPELIKGTGIAVDLRSRNRSVKGLFVGWTLRIVELV